ncbi:MAG: NYN domain-containing protein [Candidatus Eisenbacteria bacterium]|nr:NYN domain-containing protein [Candidatus Eisenbacteria bacterium]
MPQGQESSNLVVYIDFDNLAVGAREAGVRLNINLLLQRLLEKGKIIVKKAYADWSRYKDYMAELHEAGIELIEIPAPRLSGKNSADIRLVVDAMELCHSKSHIDTFVIASGDSDFSPLVAKLRENNKSVVGVGMRNSTARLLICNCDEFIFYDDLIKQPAAPATAGLDTVPAEKRAIFDMLLSTTRALLREGRETLYSSLIKDAMKRKRPDFDEGNHGYANFGELLEDAQSHGLLSVNRDQHAGGTWVVTTVKSEKEGTPNGLQRRRKRAPRAARPRARTANARSRSATASPKAPTAP